MKQKTNTIILQMNGTKSKDIRNLRKGQGKIFKNIGKILEQLKATGKTPEDAQPIIIMVRKKSKSKGIFD
ncbi:hypothetical protein [Okeania sp. SIO2B3]|uniref:DUF6200 domain-containing protein n=1 Tax=Okeania sp. SIO2B3 TaxID=2607784 RepID=UPI0013C0F02A|nr:hypothetical protein [Okeania sp. SIO2B3]NET42776.1 hypothetical protein [Okeania sp. SIO2B3]